MAVPSPLKQQAPAKVRSAREKFLSVHGVKLFNLLLYHLRNENSGDYSLFKNNLDIFLQSVPDQPTCHGLQRANSLVDQIPLCDNT